MSENLRQQFDKLELITKVKCKKARKILLKEFSSDPGFCKAVREIVKNTIKKNIKLSEKEKQKLRKHKQVLIGIVHKRKSKKRTRELTQQVGSGIFLPIALPYVASLLFDLLKK